MLRAVVIKCKYVSDMALLKIKVEGPCPLGFGAFNKQLRDLVCRELSTMLQ